MNGTDAESDLPPIVSDCGDSSRIQRTPFLSEKSVLEPVCSSACIPAATPPVGVTVTSGPAMPEEARSPVTVRVLELAVSTGSVPERLNVQAFEALPPAPQVVASTSVESQATEGAGPVGLVASIAVPSLPSVRSPAPPAAVSSAAQMSLPAAVTVNLPPLPRVEQSYCGNSNWCALSMTR